MSEARSARSKRRRLNAPAPNIAVSSHSFDPTDFLPGAEIERPINTFVDRTSGDGRRVYRAVVPIAPPSPIKVARAGGSKQIVDASASAPIRPDMEMDPDDRYEMWRDDDDPPVLPLPKKRKGYFRIVLSMIGKHVSAHLILWSSSGVMAAATRAKHYCCVRRHLENPLHVIEVSQAWTGVHFTPTSLKALGLRVQFGHPPGEPCERPTRARNDFVVMDDNAIHEVSVDYCGCKRSAHAGPPDIQLLRGGWYPASEQRPQTCMTLKVLNHFHLQTLQAKTTIYDYYQTLQKLTSNDGSKGVDRYQVLIRICREYRHLMMLKRGGRAYDSAGVEATKPGELVALCPACPHLGINLPNDWEQASKEQRFIYTLFLALDACFRLKRGLVSSELKDPGLGTGWAYMTENAEYRKYLLTVTDQKEINTCSGLAALDYANTKFSRGYSTTGVGMGVCARHEFIQPSGVGDLQKGERYANMDYVLGSILRHHDPLLRKVISYDIVCQWWKELMKRMALLPPLVRCFLILRMIAFVIPKLHIHSHTALCMILYSLNLIPGSSQTDGEGIERPWSNIGGIASSTRIMAPGARHDTIDDHWLHWNWQKLVSLAATLRRRLDKAREQSVVQREAYKAFSEQQTERVPAWKKMVHDYEDDPKKKDPYEMVVKGLTEHEVCRQFQEEEEAEARKGVAVKHKVSPGTFITECLEVEEEQIRVQAELKKAQSTAQQIDMGALRTKLIRRLDRLRKLQQTYSPASIVALEGRDPLPEELPENEPLFLPSALSVAERETGCTAGLLEMEMLMRDAQCRMSLVRLRNQLHIKARFLNYKKLHARHQGATTRSRTIVTRNESKIRLHSEKYQAAWNAMLVVAGGDPSKVGWRKLRKGDIRCMEDADDLVLKEEKRKRALDRRKRKYRELLDHGEDVPEWEEEDEDQEEEEEEGNGGKGSGRAAGESRREVSWIWTTMGLSGTDAGLEDEVLALRIEWAKLYARMRRWKEEVRSLEEEFRRLPISLEFQAVEWEKRLKGVKVGEIDESVAQGLIAYAAKQAKIFRNIAARAEATKTVAVIAKGKRRPREPIVDPLAATTLGMPGGDRDEEDEEENDEDENGGLDGDEQEERGGVESDEELVMGGEVDDE
ncbi:hypothetical protein B0H16DRAFT_1478367 [Mycena metata]|uniref:CxC2-like cysteine cluster KDZ transposase-associated domain-containing protein n=1 Tax=Mycena metata TaxID=1033252 RepID=A0AAD7H6R4_9AGAR|nr:hypothetical protein B0H16DRAFT_1478367 [Mycena metata]